MLPAANQIGTGWKSIWDPNGFNTISAAGSTAAVHIDLRPAPLTGPNAGGYQAYTLGVQGGFTIANGSAVNGAVGGNGDDVFYVNSANDSIDGGSGNDHIYLPLALSAYTLNLINPNTVIVTQLSANPFSLIGASALAVTQAAATYMLSNVELLSFADQDVLTSDIAWLAEGTLIATDRGGVPVETLRAGDRVITHVGNDRVPMPVTWVGHRVVDLAWHPDPDYARPIRIPRDAIGANLPTRDLLVSPEHALFLDGRLIAARRLVNGMSITQETRLRSVRYFHVELARHAIIEAEGLPTESYIESGNRGWFDNGPGMVDLHPRFVSCAGTDPRLVAPHADDAQAEATWRSLASRACGFADRALPETCTDPDIWLSAGERKCRAVTQANGCWVFVVPSGANEVTLWSRSARPSDSRPWLDDRRRLGVCVGRITLRGLDNSLTDLALDGPALLDGWQDLERAGDLFYRWTNGTAVLAIPGGPMLLEIRIISTLPYINAVSAHYEAVSGFRGRPEGARILIKGMRNG